MVDLSPYIGQTVNFRFRLGSDGSTKGDAWYIDDVLVQGCTIQSYNLNLTMSGSGSVTESLGQLLAAYTYGQVVSLTAAPASGWQFNSWSGDLGGSANPATLLIDVPKSVTANFGGITAVTMGDLQALSSPGYIRLGWQTFLELDVFGFNIYRAEGPDAPRQQLNASLIPATAPGLEGAEYSFVDVTAALGQTYYYWVEVQQVDGPELFGPFVGMAQYAVYLPLNMRQPAIL